jgi:hypothetical protein
MKEGFPCISYSSKYLCRDGPWVVALVVSPVMGVEGVEELDAWRMNKT